jgi:hypothetical protein
MENKHVDDRNDLHALLCHNTEKMHYQRSMCFQIRNWAIVLTVGVQTICWSGNVTDERVRIALCVVSILLLIYFYIMDRAWESYHTKFRDRLKLIENIILDSCSFREQYKYSHVDNHAAKDQITRLTIPCLILVSVILSLVIIFFPHTHPDQPQAINQTKSVPYKP